MEESGYRKPIEPFTANFHDSFSLSLHHEQLNSHEVIHEGMRSLRRAGPEFARAEPQGIALGRLSVVRRILPATFLFACLFKFVLKMPGSRTRAEKSVDSRRESMVISAYHEIFGE